MRIVLHIDMDAFFAACEEREKPWLKGRPVVVGADPKSGRGRGVVSTANYKAREYGIHSAQPISVAWCLAEKARKEGRVKVVFLGGSWQIYSETSSRIMKILRRYAKRFEQASIDEAYLEIKNPTNISLIRANKRISDEWKYAEGLARRIKEEILKKEKLTCSIGIGPNKLIAKMASGIQKPDGLTIVMPDRVQDFLGPQPVEAIPGIGPKAKFVLNHQRIKTIKDLRTMKQDELIKIFGKWGEDMYEKARGIDDSLVSEEGETKSIGEEETFEKDTFDSGILIKALQDLLRNVFRNVRKQKFLPRTVSIKVRFGDFETKSRAHTVKSPIGDCKTFEREALKLFLPFLDKRENPRKKPIRLIGVRVEHLDKSQPADHESAKFAARQDRLF